MDPYNYLDGSTIKKGDRVVLADDRPAGYGSDVEFMVEVINDAEEFPGKVIGLKAGAPSPVLHDCDGALEPNTGWWARPDRLSKVVE